MVLYREENTFRSLPTPYSLISCGKLDPTPKYDKAKFLNFQNKSEKKILEFGRLSSAT